MEKKSPFFTASVASVLYIVILLMLKLLLAKEAIDLDLVGVLLGASVFWIVIFAVHQFLKRRYID